MPQTVQAEYAAFSFSDSAVSQLVITHSSFGVLGLVHLRNQSRLNMPPASGAGRCWSWPAIR